MKNIGLLTDSEEVAVEVEVGDEDGQIERITRKSPRRYTELNRTIER
jgi:hypothetical protein